MNAPNEAQQNKKCERGSTNVFQHNVQIVHLVPPAAKIPAAKSELRPTVIPGVPKAIQNIVRIRMNNIRSKPEGASKKLRSAEFWEQYIEKYSIQIRILSGQKRA